LGEVILPNEVQETFFAVVTYEKAKACDRDETPRDGGRNPWDNGASSASQPRIRRSDRTDPL
jgi:hypothetical protein